MRKRLSGFRTAWIAAALLAVAALGLVAALLWRYEAILRPESASKLAAVGRTIGDQVGLAMEYGIPMDSLAGMDEFLKSMAGPNPEIVYVAITDAAGAPLYRHGNTPATFAAPPVELQMESGAGMVDVALPILADHAIAGGIHLGMREGLAIASLPRFLLHLTAALAIGTLLALGIVLAYTRRFIDQPLGHLRDAMSAAVDGVLSPQPPVSARGEMAAVATAIDAMLAEWKSRRDDFRQEMRELALAQPEEESRAKIDALATRVEGGA